jgi:imidazolonepropionase
MKEKADLVIKNIGQLLSMDPTSGGTGDAADPVAGLGLILDAAIAVQGEQILFAGKEQDLSGPVEVTAETEVIDAGGRAVLPGLIDCHTHLVFAGNRAHEFSKRISGSSYEEILAAGGGINSTVEATRKASEDTLVALGLRRLDRFLSLGVTTVEIKSGYGLETRAELKMLRAVKELNSKHAVDLVPTLLGAHVVPLEYRGKRAAYVDLVVEEMLPQAAAEDLAVFCDVFCEQGAFTLAESRKILEAGLEKGLKPKLHSEQLSHSGSIELAVELGAASVDHLEHASEADARRLAGSDTVAVLLPGATYFLGRTDFAPGRMLADAGCAVAVSTDFNPGSCMSENLPLMLNMACLYNRLYPREALLGATRWAARAVGLQDRAGTLTPGKLADVLVLDTRDYRNFVYHFGVNLTHMVFKRGKRVKPGG